MYLKHVYNIEGEQGRSGERGCSVTLSGSVSLLPSQRQLHGHAVLASIQVHMATACLMALMRTGNGVELHEGCLHWLCVLVFL